MKILDLFCCGGAAGEGYRRAGFDVIGIDIDPKALAHNPHPTILADALDPPIDWSGFDAVHASPPCQVFHGLSGQGHLDLITQTRELLEGSGLPYVIENIPGATLRPDLILCGSSFGLDVRRHRWFELNWPPPLNPPCAHHWQRPRFRSLDMKQTSLASVVGVHGNLNYPGELELRQQAMGIDWLPNKQLTQAIPPAYTEWIGLQLLEHLERTG